MTDRTALLAALTTMPDEAFDYFVLATAAHAMTHGARAQIWPDGIGGFTGASRASITAIRAAAAAYLDAARG
jgi:hypothetical protein